MENFLLKGVIMDEKDTEESRIVKELKKNRERRLSHLEKAIKANQDSNKGSDA